MSYSVVYIDEAKNDMKELDNSVARQVRKMITRVSKNPLPSSEGGYGTALGNIGGNNLTGLLKIKLLKLGIRVVYKLIRTEDTMKIVVVAAREDNEVYEIAARRNSAL